MELHKILVVFYSRTGTTRGVAHTLATNLGADLEELVDEIPRAGLCGYLRSSFDASFRRLAKLRPVQRDPREYELVIVGTPVWNAALSAPVRTYLSRMRADIRHTAFFVTYGGRGAERVFAQMQGAALCRPLATLALRRRELAHGRAAQPIAAFVTQLRSFAALGPQAMHGPATRPPAAGTQPGA